MSPVRFLLALLVSGLMTSITLAQSPSASPTPHRFEKSIEKFEKADQANPPARGQILFVGSSSIVKWDLKKSFPDLDVLNRGFGGSQISDSIHFFSRVIAPYKPRQVVFYAGDNDLAAKKPPQVVVGDFLKIVSLMHQQLPHTPLIFISIKPSLKRWSLIESIRETNQRIRDVCEKDPLLTYLDVVGPMLNEEGLPRPELFAADGLHLSDEGYALWNQLLRPHLMQDQRLQHLRNIYDHYHPWTPPETFEEWKLESKRIREQVLVAAGLWPMPEKSELKPVIHGLVDRGDYTVERVYFASMPGLYVTGSLYRPKHVEGKIPAVLTPHGHWANGRFTENSLATAEALLKSGAEKYMSGARSPLQARMVQLTRMGCIVFHYDMIGYADSKKLPHRGDFADAHAAMWLHNRLGLQTWNSIRALDFVTSLPDVDSNRIGVTGASGGGTQTFLLGAVDPRPSVMFPAVMVSTGMQGGCSCENADLLRTGINNVAIAALFAPRPQAMNGARDWTIEIETKGLPELRQVYSFYGHADRVNAKAYPQFPHNYNQVTREMMYAWFNEYLDLGLPAKIEQTDFWPLTREEMTVYDEKHPRPEDEMTEPELRQELRERDRKMFTDLLSGDFEKYREIIGVAERVMLPPVDTAIKVRPVEGSEEQSSAMTTRNFIVSCERARIPVTILTPKSKSANGRVVLWLDDAGKSHLFSEDDHVDPEVQKLLDAGITVASADLFLTPDTDDQPNIYETRLSQPSPGHQSLSSDVENSAFVYGYNHTILAERTRDIQAVVRALADMKSTQISLVGTGAAGVWVLLARTELPADTVAKTIVDLKGFAFDDITSNKDPNMQPGALKYGGIGGLAALAFPAPLNLYGVTSENAEEVNPLSKIYSKQPARLTITDAPLKREDVAGLFTTVP